MKIRNIYIIGAALAMLTACNTRLVPSVDQADNAIVLRAGISEGPAGVQTKAGAEDNHGSTANYGGHKNFSANTKLMLRVDGTWLGKDDGDAPHGTITSQIVSQTTTGSIGTATGDDNLHNEINFEPSEKLYWDDYGTADPANMPSVVGNGRAIGLTIYGAAIDGVSTAVDINGESGKQWNALTWALPPDQKSGWSAKDLLTSNNVRSGGDGTYKFDDYIHDLTESSKRSSNLLEFTHAMTKVTVNLTANEGFPGYPSGAENAKFQEEPKVTLLGFNYTGKVNIETKTSTATNAEGADATPENTARADFSAHRESSSEWAAAHTVTYNALVFPGNQFEDATKILKIEADGNIYYVDATKINAANTEEHNTFEQAKEYIFNITVNKTEIKVTATVKDWITVTADTEEPKINVVTPIGGSISEKNNAFTSFDFYLSDDADENHATNYNSSNRTATATAPSGETPTDGNVVWNFSPHLYWPSHSTHYHMRGVFPSGTTVVAGKISVTAGDYNSSTSPSNIMVGAPVFTEENKNCNNPDHTSVDMSEHGICAREASINLNFNYMMAQVEVHLSTPASGDDVVNLANAKVEIIDGYTGGQIDVHNKTVAVTGSTADFTLKHIGEENDNYRHSIVVPQALTHDATDLKFKITIFKSGSTTDVDDVYTAVIKNIKVKDPNTAETSKLITAWDSGKHYVYTLEMRKTEVKVTATITNWVTVDAEEDIWF